MTLIQLTYASRPLGFDTATLAGILLDARRCNKPNDITGALICRADLYLQLLEGPQELVETTFTRISRDDRHLEVRRLTTQPIKARIFARWAMRDDPARSWMWTPDEVASGAVDKAGGAEIRAVFARLASEPAD